MGTPVPIWTSAQLLQCIPNSTCTINLPCISDYFRITSSIALMAMNPIKSNHQLSPDAALVTGAASVIGTGSVATPGRASDRHKCEEHTWLGCNLTIYTLFSLSHRKLRPAIASTETSAMQWEARTRRPPNHFQLIEPEKGTKTIVIAPHKFMFCTYVTKRSHSELSRICFLPVRAVRVPRKHLRQFRPRAYCDQWGVGGSGKTMKSSNASSSSTKSLAFHLNYWICKHVRPMEGFPTLVKELWFKPNILRTMARTSGKKVALFKIKLFVSSFLATGSENCIFELSHKLDHLAKGVALRSFAPNSPERTGYKAPIVPSPIQPGATPPPYGMIIPFSGSKNLHNGQTEPGDLYSQNSLGGFVTFLVKSKNLKTIKPEKSRSGWRDSII